MKRKVFTNSFLVKLGMDGYPNQVCLALKKRGFGVGFWNGSGGKPKNNEEIEIAAKRELEEELKISVHKLEKMGAIEFLLEQEQLRVVMHVFIATSWKGEPAETEEMKPQWFELGKIPYLKMWASDREWLPIILSGKKIKAKYTYSQEGGRVKSRRLKEVKGFK